MRRPTRPFAVEPESMRKRGRGSASDEDRGRLIDEPAPEEVPNRDVSEDAPPSGDDPPFAVSGVVSTAASNTPSTTASFGDLASSVFAPQPTEPSEPSPAASDELPQSERVPPSPVPASASEDAQPENRNAPLTKPAPKPRRTPTRSLAHEEHAPDRDEQAAESARPAMMLEEQVSVAEPHASAQEGHPVPDGPKPTRRRAEPRVPAGEGWKRRRLPKVCW